MHQKIKCFYLFVFVLAPISAEATHDCSQWLAKIISLEGKVDTQYSGDSHWHSIPPDESFCSGDKIRTAQYSRATLLFRNESRATLEQNTSLIFVAQEKESTSWYINLFEGGAFFRSRYPQQLNIHTPFINAVHEGTEFLVTVDAQKTEISVFDGQVAATNQLGEIHIKKGYTGVAGKNQPPHVQALKIKPEDAVQWTLYYPPIMDLQKPEIEKRKDLQAAIKIYQQGNIHQAIVILDQIPVRQHDASYLTFKSSLLLTVGSVDEALNLIDKALFLEPDNSNAFALQSIIAVAKNRQDNALDLAQKAVSLDPESAVSQIALSYAYQSSFNIESAMEATQKAVQLSPDNALAWARLAELQLSTGERSEALKSAQQAKTLNPELDRTQIILGFAYLTQIDIDEAKTAFNQAIKLNSSDPLARLGLGLAKIRKGNIEEGTHDIESAVSLDPENALMRSYLGKAYYELHNNDHAATELSIAKEMDPNDPTPWFYDAIRKQTTNRPVEALHDMQKAIELNDNRGVYRSKLLLDEDAAARSANMSRIYQDLDFDRVALKQAWTSLGQDYTNPSAHRFLSDTLQGKPRHRIARASELLQAQLFQPINTVPVQPQLTSENIGILNSTGPGSLSSNEYDPLFTSNGAHILLNGAIGSNNTLTDNAIISGVYDQLSLSFGQFHYQTDGFRENDDYKQNIYNAFAQVAITPDLNIQVEFKSEDVTAGDVTLRFNDDFHRKNFRESMDEDTARLGLHYKIAPEHELILSAFLTKFKEVDSDNTNTLEIVPFPSLGGSFHNTTNQQNNISTKRDGYQLEVQYLFHPEAFNIIAGFGFINFDSEISISNRTDGFSQFIFDDPTFPPFPKVPLPVEPDNSTNNLKTNNYFGYLYSQFKVSKALTSIFGLSYDAYNDNLTRKSQLNPKFGLIWTPSKALTFRGSVFRTLKKRLTDNKTLEPTQIAGFNQFFDDFNGATAWNYGVGMDFKIKDNLYIGGEVMWRDTTQPVIFEQTLKSQDRDESDHLAYLYWTPFPWTAFSSEYRFSEFRRDYTANNTDSSNPRSIATHQVPLSLNFYHSSGMFSKFSSTFVKQNVKFLNERKGLDKDSSNFWIFDTAIGYRLPKKIGTLSLEVRNLFNNKNFKYHSIFDASGPRLTPFVPEREIFFKLSLAY